MATGQGNPDQINYNPNSNRLHIWRNVYRSKVVNFLRTFKVEHEDVLDTGENEDPVYVTTAVDLAVSDGKTLHIDLRHIREDKTLGDDFVDFVSHFYLEIASDVDAIAERFVHEVMAKKQMPLEDTARRFYASFHHLSSAHRLIYIC